MKSRWLFGAGEEVREGVVVDDGALASMKFCDTKPRPRPRPPRALALFGVNAPRLPAVAPRPAWYFLAWCACLATMGRAVSFGTLVPPPGVVVASSAPLFTVPARSFCKSPSPPTLGDVFAGAPLPLPLPRGVVVGVALPPLKLPRPRVGWNGVARPPPLVALPPR